MFPRNTFARQRIGRYLRHRYTRVPVVDILDSGTVLGPAATDGFNRASGTTGLGALETGEVWVDRAPSIWGITGGQAYVATATLGQDCVTTVDTDIVSPFIVQAKVWPGAAFAAGLVAHFDPATSSYVYAAVESGQLSLNLRVGATRTPYATVPVNWSAGDVMAIEVNGTTLRVLQNNVERIGPTLVTAYSTNSIQGLFVSAAGAANPLSARFDDFRVRGAPDPEAASGLDVYNDPVMTYGAPAPNQPCLYEVSTREQGVSMRRTAHGTLAISRPTLYVRFDDPLKPGDEVHGLHDGEGHVYIHRGVVEELSEISPAGPRVYQAYGLREVTT